MSGSDAPPLGRRAEGGRVVANGLKILAVAIYLCRLVLVERPQPHRGYGRLGLLLRWSAFLCARGD